MLPKISIITPCFNASEYIEQTILSILSQDYSNLEYIIIDGGSTDGTVDIIKKYEDKITYWISEPDDGQSHAINKGIAKATGDVFNWVNGDDYLEEGALQLVGDYFNNPELDVLCTATWLFNNSGTIRINNCTQVNIGLHNLLSTKGLNQQGMFWRLNRIKELNGVNTYFNYSMDLDLWKRYLINYGTSKLIQDSTITGYFRLSDDSKTGADFDANFHLFEKENNAALIQYASVVGKKEVKAISFLFLDFDQKLAQIHSICELSKDVIKKWMNELFYEKALRFFYAENFKAAFVLLKAIDSNYLTIDQIKNFNSFKRWTNIKRFF